jgi:peptidoglycan/xylan/chitin deacetylase (PgdA/CDA1 family)
MLFQTVELYLPRRTSAIWQNAAVILAPIAAALLLLGVLPGFAGAPAAANVASVPKVGPYFALTFDAHAEAQGAEELLALLRARGVHATIFVTGQFALRYPNLVREAFLDGHEIGNHTFSHPHLTTWESNRRHETRPGITRELLQRELRQTTVAITAAIGAEPAPLWRAPYGEHNAAIRSWAAELGLAHVDWTHAEGRSLDALDWVENPKARNYLSAEAMARRLIEFEARSGVPLAGSIVLMHLGNTRPDLPLLEALPIFLDETDRRGLRPVPVGELLKRSGSLAAAAP